MTNKSSFWGLMAGLFSIFVWGTTYISTKVLLRTWAPTEILFMRYLIGIVLLWIMHPHRMKFSSLKEELPYIGAGFSGITLYYLLENYALTYTSATNVGVIISTAPFFTALLLMIVKRSAKEVHFRFYIGFIMAIAGIAIISFQGQSFSLNPFGDLLALLASVAWGFYSIFTIRVRPEVHTIDATRRIFFYGILFMIPVMFLSDWNVQFSSFYNMKNLLNLLFLGIFASGLCFATWNYAIKTIGTIKTSILIYLVPVITMISSAIILKEQITPMIVFGAALCLLGLFISGK